MMTAPRSTLAICGTRSAALLVFSFVSAMNIVTAADPAPVEPAVKEADDAIAAQTAKLLEQLAEIEARLKNADPGPETRKLQQTVIDVLDALLKQPPSKKPQPQGQGGGGGGQSSAGPKPPPMSSEKDTDNNSQQPMGEPSAGDEGKSRKQSDDSTERRGPNRASSAALQRKRLEIEIWGHLPEKLRQQLLNSYGERMLPQYEAQVRKFYEKLAEPRNESSPNR